MAKRVVKLLTRAELAALKKSVHYNRVVLGLLYYESSLEISVLESLIAEVDAHRSAERKWRAGSER